MDIVNKREGINQNFLISFFIAIFILLIGVTISYLQNPDLNVSVDSLQKLFKSNNHLWILALQIIVIPALVYWASNVYANRTSNLNSKINKANRSFRSVTKYVEKLIHEDFDAEIDHVEKGQLQDSLIKLRDTLKTNKELVSKRQLEDEKRNWHAEGHAKFGEILRTNTDDINQMGFEVLKALTDYVDAIQGGFYLIESIDDKKVFDLKAFYAYGRKKYADKQINWGKGLIGTCAIERKSIHMNKLPQSYVQVTSGLGEANPRELIVCPLLFSEELFGVLELATLKNFSKDHLLFVEKVAESVASTISSVKMNMQTKHLLKESKEHAQVMAAQEEEMRQNMEELQATQEEAARQAERFMKLETTVNHTMIRAEYNTDGVLLYANTKFLQKLDYTSNSQVEGKHISMFISDKDEEWFNRIWDALKEGGRHFEGYMKHVNSKGNDLWTMATYTCVRNEEGNVDRILFLALDTTEQKEISLNLEGIIDAVNRTSIRIQFDINGNIIDYNESFLYMFKYSEKGISKLNVFDLIDTLELELFNKKWENIVNGMNFHEQFKVKTKDDEERWIRGAFCAVYDMYGEVDKVVFIGQDITSEKLMEIEFKAQNETLKKQEKLLRESEKSLSVKLKIAKQEMQEQFKEIEKIKIRNERTLEGALDAIVQTSGDNKIIFFNQAAEELLGYKKREVLGKDINLFFNDQIIEEEDFVARYTSLVDDKIVGERKEIKIVTKQQEELSVLILLSKAHVDREITYTAFIQTIEVELF